MSTKTGSIIGLFAVATTLAFVSGCGGGNTADTTRNKPDEAAVVKVEAAKEDKTVKVAVKASSGAPYSADLAKGTVKGVVTFTGAAPKMAKIAVSEQACKDHHGEKGLKKEDIVVSDDGKFANVVVYVKDDLSAKYNFADYKLPNARVNQIGCQYVPHVLAMKTGQRLDIESGDDVQHNVHATPAENPEFNYSQSTKGTLEQHPAFGVAEMGLPIVCNVHGWMAARICVFDHPFFAVTNDKGEYEIKLPPGSYTITTWQEVGKKKLTVPADVKVEVTADKPAEANFVYKPKE